MPAADILKELKRLGDAGYRKTIMRHGIREPVYGVKIEEMKKIVKRVGKDYELALELYDTGVYDAMYLAGLVADEARMTRKDLENWVERANCPALSEYTVPWVAAESRHGWILGLKWIDSKRENTAVAGWATLGSVAGVQDDARLDLDRYRRLLERVTATIHRQPDRVRYVMNGFVISVGCFIQPLTQAAMQAAAKIGAVSVDMGGTACKVPSAAEYIKKVKARGTLGKKRKSARC